MNKKREKEVNILQRPGGLAPTAKVHVVSVYLSTPN